MWLKHKQGKIIYTLLRFPLLLKTHFWPCSYAYALNFIHCCSGSLFWLLGVPIGSLFQSLGVPISFGWRCWCTWSGHSLFRHWRKIEMLVSPVLFKVSLCPLEMCVCSATIYSTGVNQGKVERKTVDERIKQFLDALASLRSILFTEYSLIISDY